MNRADRRAATKQFAQQLGSGAVDLSAAAATKDPVVLTVGYLASDKVHTAWHRSMMATAARSSEYGFLLRPKDVESGPFLTPGRNAVVKSFLENEDPYLLFTDTDIAFAPQDVAMLLATKAAIAGALYFTAALGQEPWPTALVESDQHVPAEPGEEPGPVQYVPVTLPVPPDDFDEESSESLEKWMAVLAAPIPVAGVGCGLTLYRRDAVQAVADKYEFPFEYRGNDGEDLVFCLRAAELGFETVLVPSARVGHLKTGML